MLKTLKILKIKILKILKKLKLNNWSYYAITISCIKIISLKNNYLSHMKIRKSHLLLISGNLVGISRKELEGRITFYLRLLFLHSSEMYWKNVFLHSFLIARAWWQNMKKTWSLLWISLCYPGATGNMNKLYNRIWLIKCLNLWKLNPTIKETISITKRKWR